MFSYYCFRHLCLLMRNLRGRYASRGNRLAYIASTYLSITPAAIAEPITPPRGPSACISRKFCPSASRPPCSTPWPPSAPPTPPPSRSAVDFVPASSSAAPSAPRRRSPRRRRSPQHQDPSVCGCRNLSATSLAPPPTARKMVDIDQRVLHRVAQTFHPARASGCQAEHQQRRGVRQQSATRQTAPPGTGSSPAGSCLLRAIQNRYRPSVVARSAAGSAAFQPPWLELGATAVAPFRRQRRTGE